MTSAPGIFRGPMEAIVQPGEVRVRRALLSVSDKTGIVEFARGLAGARASSSSPPAAPPPRCARPGSRSAPIEDFTGFPEIMGGRVKTLHPKLYAGLLALRDDEEHMAAAVRARGRVRRPRVREPLSVRGHRGPPRRDRARGDREHRHRRPDDDPRGGQELRVHRGRRQPGELRRRAAGAHGRRRQALARHARERSPPRRSPTPPATTARSRAGSSRSRTTSRRCCCNAFEKVTDLAYGENPHQRAAYYAQAGARMHVLSMVRQLGGKELSFNNVLDLNAARLLTQEFELPACTIIKHNNPCGVAVGGSVARGLPRGLRVRPAVRLRRRDLRQPHGRRGRSPRRC